jgi:hypothetical protein
VSIVAAAALPCLLVHIAAVFPFPVYFLCYDLSLRFEFTRVYKQTTATEDDQTDLHAMPRDMSWLSPKRRRTTTALPTAKSGRKSIAAEDERALSPSPRVTSSPKPVLPSPDFGQRTSRVFSSTSATAASESDGNLFYAYARQVCGMKAFRPLGDADTRLCSGG